MSGVRRKGGPGGGRGSCGDGDGARGREASVSGVGSSPGAGRRRVGVVETVTSAKPPRGQPPAGGKGKRRKERTAEANGADLVVGYGGEPKN